MKPPRCRASRWVTMGEHVRDAVMVLMLVCAVIVTAAAPAAADNCSGPADCGRVVQGTGLLATSLAILLGVSAAKVTVKGKVKEKDKDREKDKDPKAVPAHVQAVAGAAGDIAVEVVPRTNGSPPTFVVRIEPHADSGTQVVEEIAL